MVTRPNKIMKQKPKELDWEKEFDEEFKSLANEYCDPTNDVKDFISKTLQQQREEVIEEIWNLVDKLSMPVGRRELEQLLQSLKQK